MIAETSRLRGIFGWKPEHDSLDDILRSALDWERRWADAGAGDENAQSKRLVDVVAPRGVE